MNSNQKKIEVYEKIREELLTSLPFEIDDEHKKEEKVVNSIAAFKATNYSGTNKELADITGISKSSIQRYLTDQRMVELVTDPETFVLIKDSLLKNKQDGKIRGGINSSKKSIVIKDEKGKFVSREPYVGPIDKEQQKREDILFLVGVYLVNDTSLEKLAEKVNLTKDYVYDCLTSHYVEEIFGKEIQGKLKEKLHLNFPANIARKK